MNRRVIRNLRALILLSVGFGTAVAAQCQTDAQPAASSPQASAPAAPDANPDAQIVTAPEHPKSRTQLIGDAWVLLENALNDDKHVEVRMQGLAALGTMGTNPRSSKMIAGMFVDKDVDVRTAAVLAAGQTKNRTLIPDIKKLLGDKEPQVVFVAASTLWKMGDRSGADILEAVVNGDRKANAGLVHQPSEELQA